ncbi:hypothetical protein BDZ94DRAFT_1310681 [Collybia nuda]|uniref:GATA-type domain-containing protein n=1 Tax=Collybia nuda TaxID=64659 RepID=A0A9P6CD63_9AGAR|nr:hypothetical protein BDZ94DRAFT_1310681 [Collybia nuda]
MVEKQVCTKVASYLEQGQRLENLSWRLWHLQNLMVDTDNAKSKREFKKLSKCMGDKLDKEKGRSIEELEAPDFKRNHNTDMLRQRAVEKERNREASQHALPGTIKRMQFTFSVDQPLPATNNYPVKKPNLKPSAEFNKRNKAAVRAGANTTTTTTTNNNHITNADSDDMIVADDDERNDRDITPLTQRGRKPGSTTDQAPQSLRFPSLFSSDFGPSALLYPTPTLTTRMNYGEGLNPAAANDGFSIARPTIELPLDELLHNVDAADSPDWHSYTVSADAQLVAADDEDEDKAPQQDYTMHSIPAPSTSTSTSLFSTLTTTSTSTSTRTTTHTYTTLPTRKASPIAQESESESSMDSDDEDSDFDVTARLPLSRKRVPPLSQTVKEVLPETVAPSKINALYGTRSNTPVGRPTLTVRTQTAPNTRSSGPGATATSLNPALLRHPINGGGSASGGAGVGGGGGGGNSAPGGVKAECTNCGATHTPLWRRGLNDELNCNACGLYCKLHKRPRPKSMRNTHGEGRTQVAPRQEIVDVMGASSPVPRVPQRCSSPPAHRVAQCYNCHTTATPLWRKDDEGKTVCNACGLYYKLHGSARPISMKSDVIRKRSRHDARRSTNGLSDTPSASPGVSRRASPVREASPTLAPDSTTQMSYDYSEELDYRSSQSELLGALGQDHLGQGQLFQSSFPFAFPGPYHPDHLPQLYTMPPDPLPFASDGSASEVDLTMSPRTSKRRRMSTDSASEPPSSATSYSSYNDGGYTTSASSSATSHSQRSTSLDFPFSSYLNTSAYNTGPALRGSGNTFWHPPMMPQAESGGCGGGVGGEGSPHVFHPPMLPPSVDESPMDYLHPPMVQDDDSLFSTYLHPPMTIPDESSGGGGGGGGGHLDGHLDGMQGGMYGGSYGGHEYDTSMRVY